MRMLYEKKKMYPRLINRKLSPTGEKKQVGNLTVNYSSNFKNFSKYTGEKCSSFKRKFHLSPHTTETYRCASKVKKAHRCQGKAHKKSAKSFRNSKVIPSHPSPIPLFLGPACKSSLIVIEGLQRSSYLFDFQPPNSALHTPTGSST